VIYKEMDAALAGGLVLAEPGGPKALLVGGDDLLELADDALAEFHTHAEKATDREKRKAEAEEVSAVAAAQTSAQTSAASAQPQKKRKVASGLGREDLTSSAGRGGAGTVADEGRLTAHSMVGKPSRFKQKWPANSKLIEVAMGMFEGIFVVGHRADSTQFRVTGMNPFAEAAKTVHTPHNDAMWAANLKDCMGTICISIADSASVRQWGLEFPTINNGKDIVDTRKQNKKPRRAPIITSLPTKLTRVAILWFGVYFNWFCAHSVPTVADIVKAKRERRGLGLEQPQPHPQPQPQPHPHPQPRPDQPARKHSF